MRIAVYHNLQSGGAKRTLREFVRRMAARHELDVFTLSCAEHRFADLRPWASRHEVFPFEPQPLLRSPFGRLNQARRRRDLGRLQRVTAAVARQIDGGRYDAVFVHPCQFEQAPSVLFHLRQSRTVYYCQEPRRSLYETMPPRPYDDEALGRRKILNRLDPLPALYRGRLRSTDRRNTRAAGTVLVNSHFMAAAVRGIYGVPAQVSYLGVDIEQFAPGRGSKRPIVLSVGSLTPLKGFDFLISSLAEYPAGRRPPLVIASNFQNPPERHFLEQLARERGVQLILQGQVSDEELVRLYAEAQVVAYAPVREPFGLVALEAMACGAPVVAVSEGGVTETVVDGTTGLLVPRDTRRFASALQRLMEDPALAQTYGRNGRDHVLTRWTWDLAVASVERHLESGRQPSAIVPVHGGPSERQASLGTIE